MSRIHDALKRAEQERATSLGTHVEPSFEQPVADQMPMPPMHSPSSSGMPMASDLNYETLLARSQAVAWNPDPTTMLFFQEDETRLGAEEFRTLRTRLNHLQTLQPLHTAIVTSPSPAEVGC